MEQLGGHRNDTLTVGPGRAGYRSGGDIQPASALTGIRLFMGAVPPAILLLAAVGFLLYPLRAFQCAGAGGPYCRCVRRYAVRA